MSDERDPERFEEADPEQHGSDGEQAGLGLTEEFARIEAEIEQEVGRADLSGDEGEAGEEGEPQEVRFDETDESDWLAPVAAAGGETQGWGAGEEAPAEADDVPGGRSGEDAEQEESDLAGGEADPPEPAEEDPPQDGEAPSDEASGDEDPVGEQDDVDEAAEGAAPVAAEEPAVERTVVRRGPPPGAGGAVPIGVGGGLVEPAAEPPSLWWRFLLGSVLVVVSTATAVALTTLLFFTEVAADLRDDAIPGGALTNLDPGDPQTILILGSDERSNTPGDPGRSDTTMLLRVDAERGVLSLFSLPRDLKVDIAGDNYGTDKLNSAYTIGGVEKTLKTVSDLTGLEINHVVNVDFQGFADAVDAIGCVYVDVDRDYFNDNSDYSEDYATIDVNAGYQRMCGQNALDYVRYRHTDTDLVRAARQQDFLSQARQQVPVREVLPIISGGDTGNQLLKIFTDYTRSDISSAAEVIGVLKAFVGVIDVPIKEVHFNAKLGPTYVTASQKEIDKAVDEFLGREDTAGPRGGSSAAERPKEPKKSEPKKNGGGSKDPTEGADVVDADPLVARFAATSDRRLDFPVYFPTKMAGDGNYASAYDPGSRQYDIRDEDDKKQPAYKLVMSYTSPVTVPEYYGVEGTTWDDPPILRNPSSTATIDGRDYELYYAGDRLRLVGWREAGNSYWVSNTLLQTLDEAQMLAIATSMKEHKK